MSMEYHPVGGSVANQEVRGWRARNYDTDLMADPKNSLSVLTEYVDEILASASSGLSYGTDKKANETRYEQNYSELSSVPNFFNPISIALEIVRREEKSPTTVREHYSINVSHQDAAGQYLFGTSYMILKFVGGKMDMLVQKSTDETVAVFTGNVEYFDKGTDRWSDATEYDATQLFDSLPQLQSADRHEEAA